MAYIIDLDGTVYCGKTPIPHAPLFFEYIQKNKIPYKIVTNAPENHPDMIVSRLAGMGINIAEEDVITCAMMAVDCLCSEAERAKKNGREIRRVHVLGDDFIKGLCEKNGFMLDSEHPDCVLLSFDRSITYGQIQDAVWQIRDGALYIASNPDPEIPNEHGLLPHTGAIMEIISRHSGKEPIVGGKPSNATKDTFVRIFGCPPEEITCIGDRLDTDVAFAQACGFRSALVLTGSTTPEYAAANPNCADEIYFDFKDMLEKMGV